MKSRVIIVSAITWRSEYAGQPSVVVIAAGIHVRRVVCRQRLAALSGWTVGNGGQDTDVREKLAATPGRSPQSGGRAPGPTRGYPPALLMLLRPDIPSGWGMNAPPGRTFTAVSPCKTRT